MKYRMLSAEEKGRIIGMREGGMNCKDIAETLNVPWSTVSTILRNWRIHRTMESLKKTGRPRKLCALDVEELCIVVWTHRQESLLEIGSQVKVCRNTTHLYLRELGYNDRVVPKKPYLSDEYREERLTFAWAHSHWTCKDSYNDVWIDESSFQIHKNSR